MTPFQRRCEILANLWLRHRKHKDLRLLVDYHDLGLPLAYSLWAGLSELSEEAEGLINETWEALVDLCTFDNSGSAVLADYKLVLVLNGALEQANA